MVIIIFIGVTQVYAENVGAGKTGSGTEIADLEQLLHTADSVIDRADQWVIKWQAEGKGDAYTQAVKLAVELGLGVPVYDLQTGHTVYRSEATVGGSESGSESPVGLLLNVADTDNKGYYVIVQLSGGASLDRQALLALHGQVDKALTESGVKANWNMSVQGMMQEGNVESLDTEASNAFQDGVEIKAGKQLAAMEAKLSHDLTMTAVERYEDEATTSVSYEAAELPLQIQSGSHMLNMQLAVHQVSEQDEARITVGFPVITIEY